IGIADLLGESLDIALPFLEINLPTIEGECQVRVVRLESGLDQLTPHLASFTTPEAECSRQVFEQEPRTGSVPRVKREGSRFIELERIIKFIEHESLSRGALGGLILVA